MKKTKLMVEIFLPKVSEWCHGIRPYRNSAGKREGLTISLKEFRKLGVPEKMLIIGAKFDLAIMVPDKDEMVLAPGGVNKKGGYIGGATVDRLEELGYLPMPRIVMNDRRLGKDYVINVNHVMFYSDGLAVYVGETTHEVGSEDNLNVAAAETKATENTITEQVEQVSDRPIEEPISMVIALTSTEEESLLEACAEVADSKMDFATMEALGIFGGDLESNGVDETVTAETQGEPLTVRPSDELSDTFFLEPATVTVSESENEKQNESKEE